MRRALTSDDDYRITRPGKTRKRILDASHAHLISPSPEWDGAAPDNPTSPRDAPHVTRSPALHRDRPRLAPRAARCASLVLRAATRTSKPLANTRFSPHSKPLAKRWQSAASSFCPQLEAVHEPMAIRVGLVLPAARSQMQPDGN
ncbi:Hypothetical protein A7982_10883 [Minicystis rosea]|nr:Hypothetical protein A7982_10883 [Minicystis rosea]